MKLKKLNMRGFSHEIVLVAFVAIFAIAGVGYLVNSHAASYDTVLDVSSPQCGKSFSTHKFGFVGANSNGGDFEGNPCLTQEVQHFKYYSLYAVANYHSPHCDKAGISNPYDCGVQAGRWVLGYAGSKHVHASTWWIDTEIPAHWDRPQSQQVQFLKGMFQGMVQRGVKTIGFYSTGYQWNVITGGWRNSSPTWVATGTHSASAARGYCHSFSGGQVQWVQYVVGDFDYNVSCP